MACSGGSSAEINRRFCWRTIQVALVIGLSAICARITGQCVQRFLRRIEPTSRTSRAFLLSDGQSGSYRFVRWISTAKRATLKLSGAGPEGLPLTKSPVVHTCGVSVFQVLRGPKAALGGL
jgi:hypothetical protein